MIQGRRFELLTEMRADLGNAQIVVGIGRGTKGCKRDASCSTLLSLEEWSSNVTRMTVVSERSAESLEMRRCL